MAIHGPLPNPVATACPYCGVGCGVIASVDAGGRVTVAGDPTHPANRGRLCVKGSALGETVGLEGRLLHPMMRTRSGSMERVSWESALDAVTEGFARAIREQGPDATAFYLSGQLLTEDYYAANKLMKGFVGTANVDTNSRLCMASSVAGHRRAFGSDTVPGTYEDLDAADLLVLVGSNASSVPSDPLAAHGSKPARPRRPHRRHRSAPHRHRGRGRPRPADPSRHGRGAVLGTSGPSRRRRPAG